MTLSTKGALLSLLCAAGISHLRFMCVVVCPPLNKNTQTGKSHTSRPPPTISATSFRLSSALAKQDGTAFIPS